MLNQLSRLHKVDLRQVWVNESSGFTPWLAQEENLQLLGDSLGIELELEAQEKNVGPFRADILCKDTLTGHWIIIENQIERTDHTHLGQLLTYAAGLKAITILWIASEFTEEHRAALDWLNEITNDEVNFFGLEIELWQIGDSNIAPKFNIVSRPNGWSEGISNATKAIGDKELSPTKKLQLEFWQSLSEYMIENKCVVKPTKALPQHWMYMAIGRSGFNLLASVNTKEKKFTVGLIMFPPNAKQYFRLLTNDKEAIENEIGQQVKWKELIGRKESHIVLEKMDVNLNDESNWPDFHKWFFDNLSSFDKVFRLRIKQLG